MTCTTAAIPMALITHDEVGGPPSSPGSSKRDDETSKGSDDGVSADETLFEQMQQFLKDHRNFALDPKELCCAHLMHILKDAPATTYDLVMEWTLHHRGVIAASDRKPLLSRAVTLNTLLERLDTKGYMPYEEEIFLPNAKTKVKLVLHDIKQAIYSLLTDPRLMQDENLLFYKDDPLAKLSVEDLERLKKGEKLADGTYLDLDDIITGTRYWEAHYNLCSK